jgi:pimeloyl-ACP methyl ester carboxylesterase
VTHDTSRPSTPRAGVTRLRLSAADGTRLSAVHFPPTQPIARPPSDGQPQVGAAAIVLAPGFSGWSGKPAVAAVAAALRERLPEMGMLLLDLRGHGRSGGLTTLGDREVLDVDAAVAAARASGYERVLTMGWSMGGTCVLRHAALAAQPGNEVTEPPDAVVTVSAVSRWEARESVAMRRLHLFVETAAGRLVARLLYQVRIDPRGWVAPPMDPRAAAARLEVPLLVVHGERDHYFSADHGRALAAAAPEAQLWVLPEFGHAEQAALAPRARPLLDQLAEAIRELVAGRRAPVWSSPEGVHGGHQTEPASGTIGG